MLNYWWVTRPKRKLNSVPELLGALSIVSLGQRWQGDMKLQRAFEDQIEKSDLKRKGERRDARGSGGRTYIAWLKSLGLLFTQESSNLLYLTLAGEAIMAGKSPVDVLTNQILKYQFPSPFSIANSEKNRVASRFKIRPFRFLLRLLLDDQIGQLTTDEIAKVIIIEAENESEKCYKYVVNRILDFRERGDQILEKDFLTKYASGLGTYSPEAPYRHLTDIANTIMNWLEYTQLVYRDTDSVALLDDKRDAVRAILSQKAPFIDRPDEQEYFQRKFGLDPWHMKDIRDLSKAKTVTSQMIDEQRIRKEFIAYSLTKPISEINSELVSHIARAASADPKLVEDILSKEYPYGAVGGFMTEYFNMAFKGIEDAIKFEEATTELFRDVFKFRAKHLGQTGSRSAPDVLILSDEENYQAIIDNKAYAKYSISGDHHNRMVHNYIERLSSYSDFDAPLGFFAYIAGGFSNQIDTQIKKITEETGVHGSGMTVGNMIKLVEKQIEDPYSHRKIRDIFSLDRQIRLIDFD